jgi:proteasome accessory factor A
VSSSKVTARRITGVETEYGCMVSPPGDGLKAIHQIRDWVFENHRFGLIDRHHRDWDEPPGNGGFLFNGGRLYLDMGHVEYCTAECASAADVVRYDRAGDRLLLEAVQALGLGKIANIFRNNIDHHTGATFGCHENYSLLRRAALTEKNIFSLLSFLTLRLLFTGSGRVGGAGQRGLGVVSGTVPDFQISQRADYIQNDFYEWVQHNRAIINTRDEPLADPRKYRRLHLLHGDTNVLPSALYLKVGATRLVLDLLEINELPRVVLADAVWTLRALSHQPAPPWRVSLAGGTEADAVEILSLFRERAQSRFAGRNEETDTILALWKRVEQALSGQLEEAIGLIDWVTKQHLLETFRRSENLAWNDPWLEAQDLEYHHIDPERSLGLALADRKGPWAERLDDEDNLLVPPADTRAAVRAELMRGLIERGRDYELDWDSVQEEGAELVSLSDPFNEPTPR